MPSRMSVGPRAALIVVLRGGCARSIHQAVPVPALPAHDEPGELAVDQPAKQLLNRLTFGPDPPTRSRSCAKGSTTA